MVKCLPKSWKEHAYHENDFFSFNCQRKWDIETKLKSKAVYKYIVQIIIATPSSENFFKSNLNTNNGDFEQIYSIPFNTTIYTKLRAFQLKINHNMLYTNEKLHKVKLSDSPLCTLCNTETETLEHLLVDCDKVVII